MGCGSSRNNSVEEVVPEKICPLFLRRHEEITKRRQRPAAAMQRESTRSKKKLLKEDEDINYPNNSSDEAEAVYKQPAVNSPRTVKPTNKVAPLPEPDSEYETPTDAEKHSDTQKAEEETVAENYEHEQMEEKNDDGDDSDFGRLECPGSPSFRIYCLSPQINDKDESKSEAMVRHQKSSSVESVQSPDLGTSRHQVLTAHVVPHHHIALKSPTTVLKHNHQLVREEETEERRISGLLDHCTRVALARSALTDLLFLRPKQ